MLQLALRPVEVADLDAIFHQMRDPESVFLAAFTTKDPDDRSAFDAHMAKIMSAPENNLRAIICDSQFVGTVASYVSDGATEVTYWIDRFDRFAHVRRAKTRGHCASFKKRASVRSASRFALPQVELPKSRRPFSNCIEPAF